MTGRGINKRAAAVRCCGRPRFCGRLRLTGPDVMHCCTYEIHVTCNMYHNLLIGASSRSMKVSNISIACTPGCAFICCILNTVYVICRLNSRCRLVDLQNGSKIHVGRNSVETSRCRCGPLSFLQYYTGRPVDFVLGPHVEPKCQKYEVSFSF